MSASINIHDNCVIEMPMLSSIAVMAITGLRNYEILQIEVGDEGLDSPDGSWHVVRAAGFARWNAYYLGSILPEGE